VAPSGSKSIQKNPKASKSTQKRPKGQVAAEELPSTSGHIIIVCPSVRQAATLPPSLSVCLSVCLANSERPVCLTDCQDNHTQLFRRAYPNTHPKAHPNIHQTHTNTAPKRSHPFDQMVIWPPLLQALCWPLSVVVIFLVVVLVVVVRLLLLLLDKEGREREEVSKGVATCKWRPARERERSSRRRCKIWPRAQMHNIGRATSFKRGAPKAGRNHQRETNKRNGQTIRMGQQIMGE